MNEELKPCRNPKCSHKVPPFVIEESGLVVCPNCANQGLLNYWQTDNARESTLRAENDQLQKENDALNRYAEALECFYIENQRWGTVSDATDKELTLALAELDAVREAGNGN